MAQYSSASEYESTGARRGKEQLEEQPKQIPPTNEKIGGICHAPSGVIQEMVSLVRD